MPNSIADNLQRLVTAKGAIANVYSDSNYSTYVADICSYGSSGVALCCGGSRGYVDAGMFFLNGSYSSSHASMYIGARLMYLPG